MKKVPTTITHKILLLLIGLTSLGIIIASAIGISLVYSTYQAVQSGISIDSFNNGRTLEIPKDQNIEQIDPKRAAAIERAKQMHQSGNATVTPAQRALMENMSSSTDTLTDQERLELLQAMQ